MYWSMRIQIFHESGNVVFSVRLHLKESLRETTLRNIGNKNVCHDTCPETMCQNKICLTPVPRRCTNAKFCWHMFRDNVSKQIIFDICPDTMCQYKILLTHVLWQCVKNINFCTCQVPRRCVNAKKVLPRDNVSIQDYVDTCHETLWKKKCHIMKTPFRARNPGPFFRTGVMWYGIGWNTVLLWICWAFVFCSFGEL